MFEYRQAEELRDALARHQVRYLILILCLLFLGSASDAKAGEPITAITTVVDGIQIKLSGGAALQLQVWSDRVIRVRYSASGQFSGTASLAIIAKPVLTNWHEAEVADSVSLRTTYLEARVDRRSSAIAFFDIDATALGPFFREMPEGRGITTATLAGKPVHGPVQSFALGAREAIFGLGQHQEGLMNYVGHTVHLQQKNTEIAVPVLMSSAGYVLLWDNPSVTDVDVGESRPREVKWSSEANDTTDYYICYGPDLDKAVNEYRRLTGAAPMLGRWAWGFWQSRERYESQQEILGIAAQYRRRAIPIDGIVQDWKYWGSKPWGSHAFSPQFPDPRGLIQTLHDEHLHAMISVWAKFEPGSRNYEELANNNLLYPQVFPPGSTRWYDAFNPVARQTYWDQISREIGQYGWDGYWLDATEPELGGGWGEVRDLQTAAGPGYQVANAYPLETTTAVYQGQRADYPKMRALILTRSAYAGQQRNAAVSWSGDITGDWGTLKRQIPAGLNFAASGLPYWNTDIGGFFGGDPNDPGYQELFTRWFQFGSFCPMFRVHGTGPHKEQWEFGSATQKILLSYDQLRYRLLPYIYSLAWNVAHKGGTIMRPMVMDFRSDSNTYNIDDQFMFGPTLMVCPVTRPMLSAPIVVPSTALVDSDGQVGGLSATYYQGENFEKEITRRIDATVDFDWDHVQRGGTASNPRRDPIPGLSMDHFSARWDGYLQTGAAGTYALRLNADDGMRLWIDGKLLVQRWRGDRNTASPWASVRLLSHARIPIRIEYYQNYGPASIDLQWQPPPLNTTEFYRTVYLPAGQWRDFWTGATFVGPRTIQTAASIEKLPIFVRAGSILPMGPVVQYAGQHPDMPLEIRVYPGNDGFFELYDDAGDGYGYEKGERATIPFVYNQAAETLTIGAREGTYPGMPIRRRFNIVWVTEGQGTGVNVITKPAFVLDYDGSVVTVRRGSPILKTD